MNAPNLLNTIASEINVVYHNTVPASQRLKVKSARDAYEIFTSVWNGQIEIYESFYVLMLNRANKVLGFRCISTGGISGTVVDPKAIFQAALLMNASSLILAHNHPSGQLTPSDADIKITRKLVEAGKFLELSVLDHLIIGDNSYYSFADEGAM